jgi:hypothetical protein
MSMSIAILRQTESEISCTRKTRARSSGYFRRPAELQIPYGPLRSLLLYISWLCRVFSTLRSSFQAGRPWSAQRYIWRTKLTTLTMSYPLKVFLNILEQNTVPTSHNNLIPLCNVTVDHSNRSLNHRRWPSWLVRRYILRPSQQAVCGIRFPTLP